MPLYHNEYQAMLADTARGFIAEEGNIAKQLRHWRRRGRRPERPELRGGRDFPSRSCYPALRQKKSGSAAR